MRLTSIELQNYRCYESFRVDFEPRFNVIAGVNGSGKTSLLKAIRDAIAPVTHRVTSKGGRFYLLDDISQSARISADASGTRYRFESQYPVKLVANAEFNGRPFTWNVEQMRPSTPVQISVDSLAAALEDTLEANASAQRTSQSENALPVIAYYPAYRQWPVATANEIAAATNKESRGDGYSNWWDASSNSAALLEWVIAKSIERLQSASGRADGLEAIEDDELAIVNGALKEVLEDAKGLRYDFAQKSLLVEWTDGSPTPFENLSDGQRVAIALIVDIARRMCLLNPQLRENVTRETPGVVLIDELDIHLHPKWQRLMVKGLSAAFPRVQFIAASHSPQILSELKPEEIILLHRGVAERPQASYGLDSSRVLELIMDAKPRPSEVEAALSQLFGAIEQNQLDDARKQLANLKETAPGLPELAGAEALIKRKEVLGR